MIFERHLAKYGGTISTMAMRSIFMSEELNAFEISGGMIEYYITEGAKCMAKICRFTAKASRIPIDLIFIYYKDESENKIVFTISLLGTLIITYIKMAQVKRTRTHMKTALDSSYEREKVYTEAVDNLQILKAYRCEMKILEKYDERLKVWADAQTAFKFHIFMNDLLYNSLGAMFRVTTAIVFVRLHENCQAKSIAILLNITKCLIESGAQIIIFRIYIGLPYSIGISQACQDPASKLRVNMFNEKIELQNITFTSRERVIFSNVNMTLNKGDKAALYGSNGVGKSSIFKVILNFDKYRFEIYFDKMNLKNVNICDYRSLITYVPQDTKLFDLTILDNLKVGNQKSFAEVA